MYVYVCEYVHYISIAEKKKMYDRHGKDGLKDRMSKCVYNSLMKEGFSQKSCNFSHNRTLLLYVHSMPL